MGRSIYCFVVMPFRPELNYFFLYIKYHLNSKFGMRIERGDHKILTKALMDKVRDQIVECDFLIADITKGNPNVFYEIGVAHSIGKAVIFITQDELTDIPVDIRQFEFIRYDLARHEEFLSKLDNAVQNVVVKKYVSLHQHAVDILRRFNGDSDTKYLAASLEEFQARVMRFEQTQEIPPIEDGERIAKFLLPKILSDAADVGVMQQIMKWVNAAFPAAPAPMAPKRNRRRRP